ncbi:MAG TPA: HlyD family type I secretion periplasmic adaptor subunit [Verrucomicrobiales bacterium]|nr:HlyD family type I secretion periplasmic adaptor subunit [Verrucomicrobiales bacterium]
MNTTESIKETFKTAVRRDDLEYVQSARAAIKGDRLAGANFLLFSIVGVIVALIAWAANAKIDEVTKGQGKVIPSSSIQTIQNLEGGIVAEIFIREGSRVEKGEIIVRIDDTLSASSYRENLAKSQAFRAALARLDAEAKQLNEIVFPEALKEIRQDLIQRETTLFNKRRSDLAEQRGILDRSLKLASDELTMTIPLVQKGIVSRVEQLRLEREVNELEGKLKDLIGTRLREAMEQYNEIQAQDEELSEMLQGREDRVQRTSVRSPIAGTVNKIYMNTIGGVIQPGEPIADIVPENGTLLVEAKIRPSDIAFISPGQEATLKFSAYDFSIYGGLKGTVENISADTIQDEVDKEHYYMIKVRNDLGKLVKDGHELPLIPGMVVEVDVLTGQRTVLQYLTKPFHRMRFNALRER